MITEQQPLVSVIVPVYNSLPYFEACLKSIIEQSYQNIEIILVNDGCTDATPDIIHRYMEKDSRIKVINKQNQGTQFARRDGVAIAIGKYIQTVDCDDQLYPNAILQRVTRAEQTGADLVVSPFTFCPQGKAEFPSTPLDFEELSGLEYFKRICYKKAYWATWTILQRRSLYINQTIEYDPDIMLAEDTVLSTQLALLSQKVVACHEPVVKFLVRADSLSHSKKIDDIRLKDLRKYPIWIEQYVNRLGLSQTLAQELAFLKIRVSFESISKQRLEYAHTDIKQMVEIINTFPKLKQELTRREKKILAVYKISPFIGWLNIYRYHKQKKL